MPDPTSSASGHVRRLAWADMAKALSIVLVVLHHTVGKHLGLVVPVELGRVEDFWHDITYALKPVRMPLFFVVSGLFAGAALTRPWREVVHKRVTSIYYLYALWLTIHMGVFLFFRELAMNRTRDWTELASDLVYASTGLWYLYALVVYFLLARLLVKVDPRVVVAGAAVLALVAPTLAIEEVNRVALLQHFVYFAFAAHFPQVVARMAELRRREIAVVAGAATVLGLALSALGAGAPATRSVVSVFAVPLALRAAALLAQWRPAASLGQFIGERTLPIYVLHVPVLAVLHALFVDDLRFDEAGLTSALALVLYPLAATCAIVLVCLAVHHVVNRSWLDWLFTSPFGQRTSQAAPTRARQLVEAEPMTKASGDPGAFRHSRGLPGSVAADVQAGD